uniref:Putative alpha-macroglobulin n=2 Tax=Ixodes ricinus TaxID=34613 RepID=A0A6B0VFH8_IXORI
MATDKAVYILDKGQLLTRQKLLSSFRSHDLGCGPGGGVTSEEVISQAGIVIISSAMKEDVITTDGSCEAKKRRRRNAVRQSIESYQDPLLKECCWLGIQPDKMVRHCSTRSEIVKRFMPGPDGARCADVFAKCCVEAENFDRGRTDVFGGPASLQDVIDADYNEDLYSSSSIRKNFRETWMFREGNIGEDGIAKFEGSLPHSITKWFVQAVSVSPDGGICVAEPAEVTAFRKVFLQVDLPYKVVRNEQVEVLVTVYNYGSALLYGAVFLHGVPGVCTGARHQLRPDRKPVEVKAQSAASVTFPVIPTLEGKHTIRILVNTSQGIDSVEKILNVVPEGITVEKNISIVLDPTNQQQRKGYRVKGDFFTDFLDPKSKRQNIKIDTRLPLEAVPNTGVLSLGVMGNQMESTAESTIANVESLISLPRGCGEQNMMLMAPTLYALEYLKHKNYQNTAVMEKAYRYIQQGYEQELAFRNDDGSFSTFKQRKGSLWLTAFVLRVLCKATKVINIDHRVLHSGVSWLAKQQRADGDFEDESPLMHGQMLGGVNGRVPMTAFVLLTLYECGSRTTVDQQTMLKVTARAENFLNERINVTKQPYVAALVAYALSLDKGEKQQEAFQVLKDHLLYDEEMNGLSTGNDATALDVEGTSYALLAYLRHGDVEGGARLVNWLNRHRSASGSFTSTQDTVVALQALTESGLKVRDSIPDLMCNITANRPKNIFHSFRINRRNAFVLQEVHIKDIGGKLLLSVSGEGTGVLTSRLRYNVLTPPEKLCKFSLAVRASRPDPGQTHGRSRMVPQEVWKELLGDAAPKRTLERMGGHSMIGNDRASLPTVAGLKKDSTTSIINKWKTLKTYEIEVCIRYLGEQDSNMAILEVGMFSGFHPSEKDLENLTATNALLGKYELTTKGVVFYFDKVPADRDTCIMFRAERAYHVLNIQTATVKVYDYYRPDHSCSQFYGPETSSPLLGLFCDGPHCKCASVWKVNVSDIQVSNGYKNVVFNVTSVIKEGEESKEVVTGKLRSFLMRQLCNTVNFVPGKFYFILGQDSEFIEEKGSRIARYVLNGKVKIYAPNKNDRRSPSRKIRTSFEVLLKKFAKNESCID